MLKLKIGKGFENSHCKQTVKICKQWRWCSQNLFLICGWWLWALNILFKTFGCGKVKWKYSSINLPAIFLWSFRDLSWRSWWHKLGIWFYNPWSFYWSSLSLVWSSEIQLAGPLSIFLKTAFFFKFMHIFSLPKKVYFANHCE